jgi:hypothetical protein
VLPSKKLNFAFALATFAGECYVPARFKDAIVLKHLLDSNFAS